MDAADTGHHARSTAHAWLMRGSRVAEGRCVQELPQVRADLHGVRLVAEEAAAGGDVRTAVLALERDIEVLKKRMAGSLVAALGADSAALAGAARQADVLALSEAMEKKLSRGDAQVRCVRVRASQGQCVVIFAWSRSWGIVCVCLTRTKAEAPLKDLCAQLARVWILAL